ncbi:hypothetical protein BJ508DRAFT_379693 [Ascobolus immersus RN42]|uniref:Uncharacterized protein n=1 Tax=Ascobolus immersus RN42 TaxID=1160509 RepID=A0A3N4HVT9_ASCIM|nr:hypothetical protein BJ508DRAFT_379693 [Ascobolus immersus RN42]
MPASYRSRIEVLHHNYNSLERKLPLNDVGWEIEVAGGMQRLISARRSWDPYGCVTLDCKYAVEYSSKISGARPFFQRRVVVTVNKHRVATAAGLTREDREREYKFMMPRGYIVPQANQTQGPAPISSYHSSSIRPSPPVRPTTNSATMDLYDTSSKKRKLTVEEEQHIGRQDDTSHEPITPRHLVDEARNVAFRLESYLDALAVPYDEKEVFARRIQDLEKEASGLKADVSTERRKTEDVLKELHLVKEKNQELEEELVLLKGQLKQVVDVAREKRK